MAGSTRTVTLIGVDGSRTVLACADASPYQLGTGAQLWGTAPYSVTSRRIAQIPGEHIDTVQAQPRTIVVPIRVGGATEQDVDQYLGQLGAMLSPVDDVRILYRRPDGTERELTARYVGRGDAVEAMGKAGYLQRFVEVPLLFRAYWPYWRATSSGLVKVGPTTFTDGRTGGSNLVTITNPGDVAVYPEITITGYSSNIEATSLTTGQGWRVTTIINAYDELRIDHDPRTFGTWLNGLDDYTVMDQANSQFWALVPGPNVILFRASTATGAESIGSFTVRVRPLFESC